MILQSELKQPKVLKSLAAMLGQANFFSEALERESAELRINQS